MLGTILGTILALTIVRRWWMLLAVISIATLIPVIRHDDGGGYFSGLGNFLMFFVYWLPFNGLMWLIYFIIV